MTLAETLIVVWQQLLTEDRAEIRLDNGAYKVKRTRSAKLKMVDFDYSEWTLTGIEQNPEKASRWAAMARKGKRIVQYKCENRFIGNVCNGRLTRYPAWKDAGLPD